MQNDFQLTVPAIARRLAGCYGDREVITLREDGPDHVTYAAVDERVARLARALDALGVQPGERVGTFAWNNQRHFELYLAVPSVGAVLHTVNIRLFPEQIAYILNHASDRVVFVDDSLVPMLAPLVDQLPNVRQWVVMGDGPIPDGLPGAISYEELLSDAGPGGYDFPELDERQAAALCYTSGTTGNPKGVLYSHRSIALHSTAMCMADSLGVSAADRLLAIVPMFHVNAWGLPYSAALTGATLLMPGPYLQGAPLARMIEIEGATLIAGVPTVLSALLAHVESHGGDLSSVRGGICGGAAVPRSLMEGFERRGIRIHQAWGMTETAPLLTIARPGTGRTGEEEWADRLTAGRLSPWVEARIVSDDGLASHDGEATGEIEVRGPWVASAYFEAPEGDDKFSDGWLRTGDIGAIDSRGFVRLTDRAKDLIKSGGEWISSVELENELISHPDVREAAVIAMPTSAGASGRLRAWCSRRVPRSRPGAAQLHRRQLCPLADPRRLRLRRRDPEDERRKARQEGAAEATRRWRAADPARRDRRGLRPRVTGLTVAVTGPSGEIGRPFMRALEREPGVAHVRGMARGRTGAGPVVSTKAVWLQGDVQNPADVDRLVAGADVVVHLAFAKFGSPEQSRRVNLAGSRNVFDAAIRTGAERIVYTSSVAAYGSAAEDDLPLDESTPARGNDSVAYSAQKAELERALSDAVAAPRWPRTRCGPASSPARTRSRSSPAFPICSPPRPCRHRFAPSSGGCPALRCFPTSACRCNSFTATTWPPRSAPRSSARAPAVSTTSPARAGRSDRPRKRARLARGQTSPRRARPVRRDDRTGPAPRRAARLAPPSAGADPDGREQGPLRTGLAAAP